MFSLHHELSLLSSCLLSFLLFFKKAKEPLLSLECSLKDIKANLKLYFDQKAVIHDIHLQPNSFSGFQQIDTTSQVSRSLILSNYVFFTYKNDN